MYLHFQATIIPESTPVMKLQFQYLDSCGPYAFYNMSESAYDQVKPWKNAIRNDFTRIEQILTVHLKYVKLTPGSDVGGIRLSIYDNNSTVLHKSQKSSDKKQWPFKPLSLVPAKHEFSLFRADRVFTSWKQVVGKTYSKSVPFINPDNDNHENIGLLDYFAPRWVLNVFVPRGIQHLLSWENIYTLFGRSDYKVEDRNIKTMDMFESHINTHGLDVTSVSTGFIVFNGELEYDELRNTNMLVELDLSDVYITEGYIKFEYVLSGVRWWVYWWPGISAIIGVFMLWGVSVVGFVGVTWAGFVLWTMIKVLLSTEKKVDKH